jgi:hypothetical protein
MVTALSGRETRRALPRGVCGPHSGTRSKELGFETPGEDGDIPPSSTPRHLGTRTRLRRFGTLPLGGDRSPARAAFAPFRALGAVFAHALVKTLCREAPVFKSPESQYLVL